MLAVALQSAKYGHKRVWNFTYKRALWLVPDDKVTLRYEITLELKVIQVASLTYMHSCKSLGLVLH